LRVEGQDLRVENAEQGMWEEGERLEERRVVVLFQEVGQVFLRKRDRFSARYNIAAFRLSGKHANRQDSYLTQCIHYLVSDSQLLHQTVNLIF